MSNKQRASTSSADSSQCRPQPIRADFINSKKLPARLDRLLGEGQYECHWQLNHYILNGPRHLSDVSICGSVPQRLSQPRHLKPVCLLPTQECITDPFASPR